MLSLIWRFCCISIILPLIVLFSGGRRDCIINKNDLLTTPNTRYIVQSTLDLGGRIITVPEGCTLVFKRDGKILNGTIVGNQTKVLSLKKQCLGVDLKGSWFLSKIDDTIFDFDILSDNQILDNITALQSDRVKNTIVLNRPVYKVFLTKEHRKALSLASNTVLLCNSTIEVQGNDLPIYIVIGIDRKKDVAIKGGWIKGDVGNHRYIEGSTSEWGFGLSVFNSANVRIEGIHISKCTGDGIYIGGGIVSELEDYSQASKNVYITDAICDDNRRQGISITYADGVVLKNCTFSNTGKTEFTRPGCGLDIEPNAGQAVRDVKIKRCRFLHNDRIMDVSVGGYKTEDAKCNVEKILFDNCTATGTVSIRTGSLVMRGCTMKSLDIHLAKMPKDKVLIAKCDIQGGQGVRIRTVGDVSDEDYIPLYRFNACTIGLDDKMTSLFSTVNHRGNEKAEFVVDDCSIVIPKGDGGVAIVPSKSKMPFSISNCKIQSNGRFIELDNEVFSNCRIIDGRL